MKPAGEIAAMPAAARGTPFGTAPAPLTTSITPSVAPSVISLLPRGLGLPKWPAAERVKIALEYTKLVSLDGFAKYYPHRLSGGMNPILVPTPSRVGSAFLDMIHRGVLQKAFVVSLQDMFYTMELTGLDGLHLIAGVVTSAVFAVFLSLCMDFIRDKFFPWIKGTSA